MYKVAIMKQKNYNYNTVGAVPKFNFAKKNPQKTPTTPLRKPQSNVETEELLSLTQIYIAAHLSHKSADVLFSGHYSFLEPPTRTLKVRRFDKTKPTDTAEDQLFF